MIRVRNAIINTVCAAILTGCSAVNLNPTMNEPRIVSAVEVQNKHVILNDSMVWYDDAYNKTRGILFPKGRYILEAQDDDYYYFKAPSQFDYRTFENGEVIEQRMIDGGLFLGKSYLQVIPAGAYINKDEKEKILTWKLGGNFISMEGEKWVKNY